MFSPAFDGPFTHLPINCPVLGVKVKSVCMRGGPQGENQFCGSVGARGAWFTSSHVRVSEEEEWSELKRAREEE